jgi:hypothetical protein
MTPEQLVEIPGIGEKMVEKIHQSVAMYFQALEQAATAAPEPVAAETTESPVAGPPAPDEAEPGAEPSAEGGASSTVESEPETTEEAVTAEESHAISPEVDLDAREESAPTTEEKARKQSGSE